VASALAYIGDKWTMLIVRDLSQSGKRTTELLAALHPISSRTLVARLRDMEHDELVARRNHSGSPPHVEYELTARGRLLLPLLEALRNTGEALEGHECMKRKARTGAYCEACPENDGAARAPSLPAPRRAQDDSIILL
jgi:DNA-binding HxlR family transcriptional regulator